MNDTKTQNDQIEALLKEGKKLTALHALTLFGCMHLSSRIHDLRYKRNLPVQKETIKTATGKYVAQYSL